MPIRTRNHLAELNTRILPSLCLIAITKVVRSSHTVKHHELSEFILTFQNMPQRRPQRRNTSSHRNKNQIPPFYFINPEPAPTNVKQFDLVTNTHVINDATRAGFLLHKH